LILDNKPATNLPVKIVTSYVQEKRKFRLFQILKKIQSCLSSVIKSLTKNVICMQYEVWPINNETAHATTDFDC